MKTKNRTGQWLMFTKRVRVGKYVLAPGLTQVIHDDGTHMQFEILPGHRGFVTNADLRQPEYGIELL